MHLFPLKYEIFLPAKKQHGRGILGRIPWKKKFSSLKIKTPPCFLSTTKQFSKYRGILGILPKKNQEVLPPQSKHLFSEKWNLYPTLHNAIPFSQKISTRRKKKTAMQGHFGKNTKKKKGNSSLSKTPHTLSFFLWLVSLTPVHCSESQVKWLLLLLHLHLSSCCFHFCYHLLLLLLLLLLHFFIPTNIPPFLVLISFSFSQFNAFQCLLSQFSSFSWFLSSFSSCIPSFVAAAAAAAVTVVVVLLISASLLVLILLVLFLFWVVVVVEENGEQWRGLLCQSCCAYPAFDWGWAFAGLQGLCFCCSWETPGLDFFWFFFFMDLFGLLLLL